MENRSILDNPRDRKEDEEKRKEKPIDPALIRTKYPGQVYFDGQPVRRETDNGKPWYLK